jgi:crossover junction endodeoxyribonuclease RuvC
MGSIDFTMGLDPGSQGAIVRIWKAREVNVVRFKDRTEAQIIASIKHWEGCGEVSFEVVHAMPSDGKSTLFQFGKNVGFIEGVLLTLGYTIKEVSPQTWQRAFGLGAKFPTKQARKHAHRDKAQELFPDIHVTLDIADALLIAEYAWRLEFQPILFQQGDLRPGTGIIKTRVYGESICD